MKTRLIYLITCLCVCVACSKDDTPAREEFVDDNFIELLHTEHNVPLTSDGTIDLDNEMTQLRLKSIVKLNIYDNPINDLTGIRNLVSLDQLYFRCNIESLDLSGMKYLRELKCYSPSLGSLNIRDTPMLEYFEMGMNQLTSLDLSGHPQLQSIYCMENKLTSLRLEDIPELNVLYCHKNHLSTLNASGMKLLHNKLFLECGNQTDENGNPQILHLTLSEGQREAWQEKVEDSPNTNANVEVTFK